MLRIDRNKRTFSNLDRPTLADVSITERYNLQECIFNSPLEFFREIGQELFVIGREVTPSESVPDRIDLLCVNKEGACVVVELKRGNHKLHMMQAISYAGMLAGWSAEDVLELLDVDQREALIDFLDCEIEEINRSQRIILIAESFDFALLMAAAWLCEQYGVDVACCQVGVATDAASGAEYLVCSNIYPTPELAQRAAPRGKGRRKTARSKWTDWDAALANIKNAAVVEFYRQQVAAGRESRLSGRVLFFRVNGKRRLSVKPRINKAYAWQDARFEGDVEFWRTGLSIPTDVQIQREGTALRFYLHTTADFKYLERQASIALNGVSWIGPQDAEDADEPEE